MSKLASLKSATSLADVAALLNFSPSGLAYVLYKIPENQKYRTFRIPKKSGGYRTISAPTVALKTLQSRLSALLYECREEIEANSKRKPLSNAYRKNRSIVDNAKIHKSRRFVLNLDLKDFFPTFNFGRVRGFFIKDNSFKLHDKVATVLAQIACFEGGLPQGSPCSPIIADLIAHILDIRLVSLAKRHKVSYSRYADDITFSTNQKTFPPELADLDRDNASSWALGDTLVHTISNCGFRVADDKTRMQFRGSRQVVTGLTVNVKVNTSENYYRQTRSMCRSLFAKGTYHQKHTKYGPTIDGAPHAYEQINDTRRLAGRLSHIHFVKRQQIEPLDKKVGFLKLYKNFLFYQNFVALAHPVVVCEGQTDNIYIRSAMRHIQNLPAALGTNFEGAFSSNIRFFSYKNKTHPIVGLTGGSEILKDFASKYEATLKTFQHRPLAHPVIMLFDNDNGSKSMFSLMKEQFGIDCSLQSTEPFYHLTDNLYFVKTIESPGNGGSHIEMAFDPAIQSTVLDGKKFNPANKINTATDYGKVVFAEKVVVPQAQTINWNGFSPLLDRIALAITDYAARIATHS